MLFINIKLFFVNLSIKKCVRCLSVSLLSMMLFSCGGNTDDLESWVIDIKSKRPGRIEPMPDVKVYQPFEYASSALRSPFTATQPEIEMALKKLHMGCDESLQPDPSRRREPLERFSLDSMEMVGTLRKTGEEWGLIRMTAGPSSGTVVDVRAGEFLGINHGRIISISNQQIEIVTLVPDSKGCWEQRAVYMTLTEG